MKGTLHILDKSGDSTVEWDTAVENGPLDPAYAKREFDRLVEGGHMAFGTTKTGENEHIRSFDPEQYEKVTVTPQFVGG